jgi:hypothetical protein
MAMDFDDDYGSIRPALPPSGHTVSGSRPCSLFGQFAARAQCIQPKEKNKDGDYPNQRLPDW